MEKYFNVGDVLYGYCDGAFGRDDYDTKICMAVNNKYAVFQYLGGAYKGDAILLNYSTLSLYIDKEEKIKYWKNEDEEC